MPVETIVSERRDQVIEKSIRRELERGGQVFFLHNRVETIEDTAARLQQIVPDARFRVAHGQMDEASLEETMADLYAHEFDVLVCTTIIESGVNIPNANTLIVDDADHLGLAQLYQLRGRVGRSDRQAYSVFLYRNAEALTEVARQRLAALQEFSQLGAGQKIALRDLELRGAGSLLGVEQSGPVAAVGLDLYLRLLESSVRQQQGKKPDARLFSLPIVELPVTSGMPADYVSSEVERLRIYNQMASVRKATEIDRLQTDIERRFGLLPPAAQEAFEVLRLRVRCQAAGGKSITFENGSLSLILRKGHLLPESIEAALRQPLGDRIDSVTEDRVILNVPAAEAREAASSAVDTLASALAARRATRRAGGKKQAGRKAVAV